MAGPEASHVQRCGECGGEDGDYTLLSSSTILLHTVTTSGVRHEHVEEVPVLESCWLLQPAAVPAGNV